MILFDNVALSVGSFRLDGISFEVPKGSYAMLMGRTGSGKTTLLEAVCGLRRVERGRILLDGEDVTHWRPGQRGVGFVPQEGALFNTMTVFEHLAFALRIRSWSAPQMRSRVETVAEQLGITPLLQRHPLGLSGGERQRVALGRAIAAKPRVLCLDEPLSALDSETRAEMCDLLERVKLESNVTLLHITHDRREAERLADVVFEMASGGVRKATLAPAGAS